MLKPTFFLIAALLAAPAGAVNKCTGPDGKVSFQDKMCDYGTAETLKIRPVSSVSTNSAAVANDPNASLQKLKRDNDIAEAIRIHKPLVGMTVAQLQEAMGRPTKVNGANYSGNQSDQLIYERPQETWYVYPRNGFVESVQHRPGAPIGARTARAAPRCPAPNEIKNAITSANSMTISEAERVERWKSIKAMQTCGK